MRVGAVLIAVFWPLGSYDDGVAASLTIALRRKRAWLQFVARRLLLVPSGRL
jgi:hypothetical protein